ncbi:MAG: DUF1592 domain-containing protein [Planctomycetes bacterium]|nr:DUF1592 domain-containing protein [Planctomycetota bacterium]
MVPFLRCILMSAGVASLASVAGAVDAPVDFARDIKPVIDAACVACHSGAKAKAGLDLQRLAPPDSRATTLKHWRLIGTLLTNGDMPPEDATAKLAEADRDRLIAWIAGLRYTGPQDPGRVTLRRLNRSEYANTVRDLLGVEFDPTQDFPTDDVGDGFDNQADVLSLAPLLFEKYTASAQRLIDKAVPVKQVKTDIAADGFTATAGAKTIAAPLADGMRVLKEGGEFSGVVYAPVSGKYTIKLALGADQVGPEPVRVAIKVDGQVVKELKVTASRKSHAPQSLTLVPLDRGEHQLAILFLNPLHLEKDGKTADRALAVAGVELQGPTAIPATPAQKKLMCAEPSATIAPREAARTILAAFLPRAWRHPVDKEDVERLLGLFDQAVTVGDPWEVAIRQPLQAALLSPNFLYRVERDPANAAGNVYKLSDHEIASRLSYFLWASMPDEALFAAAAKGELTTIDGRKAQTTRMLKDPKARSLIENFTEQWLMTRNLEAFTPDPKLFREFTPALRKAMADEPIAFMATMMQEDRSVLEFIKSDWTMVNAVLAKHYGMSGVDGAQMRKVTLTERERGGVLTMAGVLAVTSNPDRTNPPRRGKFVLEQMLNDPPPPPPPMVPQLPKKSGPSAGMTTRQLFERHRSDASCMSCHKRIDPIGFAFEAFDVLGRVRARDGNAAIDTSGVLPGGIEISGVEDLKKLLSEGKRREFLRCLAAKMTTYAIGRGMQPFDEPAIDALVDHLAANDHRFSALILGVVESYPFLHRRIGGPP